MQTKIGIIGQGYVGLPLALAAAKAGYSVLGYDNNVEKIDLINQAVSPIGDIDNTDLQAVNASGRYRATSQIKELDSLDVILICVPTPLTDGHKPDLSNLESALKSIAEFLSEGTLVIIESTIAPGSTRNFVLPLLEKHSKVSKSKLLLAYSPERIDPANEKWQVSNTPKLVAGLTEEAAQKAKAFYSKFINQVDICGSLEVAETAKLLENSFRLVNISFINELAIFCQKIGIDINDVVKAAATKPYGFMPFYPSVGVGGHCIPVDPLYLASAAKEAGAPTRFIELADQINLEMPNYFVGRANEILGGLKGKKVLVIGVAYKPNVADVRETPVTALITGLEKSGASVSWHDDLVKTWNNQSSVPITDKYDLAIIATPHDYIQLSKLGNTPILNTRGSK
jgi:UDP-N-acetyl-D-glucosamine dehydrogenase